MKTKGIISHLCLFIICSISMWPFFAQAQTEAVVVSGFRSVREQDQVSIYMSFILNEMRIRRNEMIVVTPVLKANNGNESLAFPPVIVTGSTRSKVLDRKSALREHNIFETTPYTVIKRINKTDQRVDYATTVPFSQWITNASLSIDKQIIGCAECKGNTTEELIVKRIIKEPYIPTYRLTYVVPEAEPVKIRSERHAASFAYKVDKSELLHNYKNNASELADVDKVIKAIQENKDLSITEFTIAGYASPEGSFAHNMKLSQNRANSFVNYLVSTYGISHERFNAQGFGEDWAKLREMVSSSFMTDKQEILDIIDQVEDPDARDAKLKGLSGGKTYGKLLNMYYPLLRRTDYTIAYAVKAFDVEEARRIIRTNPKLLSLNEMYLVARSYPPQSKEFNEVFDIAVRLYPDSEFAIVNSAAADIEGGNTESAIERMNKIADNPKVWNNLGVAYARRNETGKARTYFYKAVAAGYVEAGENIKELQKYADNINE